MIQSTSVSTVSAMLFTGGLTLWGCLPASTDDFADWPVDAAGYEIEQIPANLAASYVRGNGNDVYLGLKDGTIWRADDRDLSKSWTALGRPYEGGPRLLFASSGGAFFDSPHNTPIVWSDDSGQNWQGCLGVPVWRMEEDDQGSLYAGNYNIEPGQVATLYKSADGGHTWNVIFQEPNNDHIHTVRWDDRAKRLYIAYGDGPTRGQAYSDDRGATFRVQASGRGQGHTDVAITTNYVIWGSDHGEGLIYRVDRQSGATEALLGRSQYMWFVVAEGKQVYVGTMASQAGDRGSLLASADEGTTWQKLLETSPADASYGQGFVGESRNLSAAGWLYCAAEGVSYRVRRSPAGVVQP